MTVSEVVASLRIRFKAEPFDLGIEIAPPHLLEALRALRDTHGFRFYICATAIDHEGAFEVVHGLRKPDDGDEIWIKTRVPHEEPVLDSASFLFAGAEWHEREILDLFGMTFRSHPDPRRILMPDDYEGHPLRKDFPMDTPWGYRPPTIVGDA